MKRVFRIPLEVLPERYTAQWAKWIPPVFERAGFSYNEIPGVQLSDSVETGKVLDASGTMYFKFSQMQRIAELFKTGSVQDGDIFFVDDIQYPGAWSIKYMAELYGITVYLFGYLHASSYTKEDFAEPMAPFMKSVEKSWVFLYDKIFVGTHYHKNAFINRRFPGAHKSKARKKLYVSGGPWNVWTVQQEAYGKDYKPGKLRRIIFPSRFDIEKRPNVFLKMADFIHNVLDIKDIEFLITTSRKSLTQDLRLLRMVETTKQRVPTLNVLTGLKKSEYYAELSKSKAMVSTTIEENFGYCVVESLSLNTPVLVPNKYSHPELLSECSMGDMMLYDISWDSYIENFTLPSQTKERDKNIADLSGKALYLLDHYKSYDNLYESVLHYNKSTENMCKVINAVTNRSN